MSVIVSAIFRLRGDTATNWQIFNPVLDVREPAIETDTRRLKIGDGETAWTDLPYATPESTRILEIFGELTPAADSGIYFIDAETASLFDLTAFGRSLAGVPDREAALELLELGGLEDRLSAIEQSIAAPVDDLADHEARITALEGSGNG